MSNGIEVKKVSVEVTFPRDAIPMVFMQPLIEIPLHKEPYCWPEERAISQCDAVRRTLEVALNQQARFTVFPEYSLPGPEVVGIVDQAIRDDTWKPNSIVIAKLSH